MSDPEIDTQSTSPRLASLDALRGFDMCWILGLSGLVKVLLDRLQVSWRDAVHVQLEHVPWEGFHFYDLIFPLFLFIAGVSLAISLPRRAARHGVPATAGKLVLRAAVLFFIGVIYSGGLQKGFDQVRWLGVLQRIALGSCFAGLLSLWLPTRGLVMATVVLLAGYWGLLAFVPLPDGDFHFAEGHNLTNYLDHLWLPGRKYDGDHDPEGILSTLPAIATALLGILAGKWITGAASPSSRKALGLVVAGAVLLGLGWVWHPFFPVVKKLWTSSFVLVAGGWSAILLGGFYYVIEVLGWKGWTAPFVWVGTNPILLYLCSGLGFFRIVTERLTGPMKGDWAWVPAAVSFALVLLVARFLYRRGIFLRA